MTLRFVCNSCGKIDIEDKFIVVSKVPVGFGPPSRSLFFYCSEECFKKG